MTPEREVLEILKARSDFLCALPCDKFKNLYALAVSEMQGVEVAREEEGVGISAGAALAGRKPAMLIQNSGLGNMVNALASLTKLYELPLAIIMSWRGVYREPIEAQKPMGRYAPRLLEALEIPCYRIEERENISEIGEALDEAYSESKVVGVLLSPKLWEGSPSAMPEEAHPARVPMAGHSERRKLSREHIRYDFISSAKDFLRDKAVVCNLGLPSKELYSLLHQEGNFYMLGSMGMASPIALGVALNTRKEVVALEGDGSLLMNPSTMTTIAKCRPGNLTIIALDNASYGSTGSQPTSSAHRADLACAARCFGFDEVRSVDSPGALRELLAELQAKPAFIRCVCMPGNARVEDIPLKAAEIKSYFMEFLR